MVPLHNHVLAQEPLTQEALALSRAVRAAKNSYAVKRSEFLTKMSEEVLWI